MQNKLPVSVPCCIFCFTFHKEVSPQYSSLLIQNATRCVMALAELKKKHL